MLPLELVNPKFRKLVDRLFFTDRTDLDTSGWHSLFANNDIHFEYLLDRITRSREIFWEESFWVDRFEFLLTVNPRKIEQELETQLISEFRQLLMHTDQLSPQYNNVYLQLIAWTKAKNNKKLGTKAIEELLVGMLHFTSADQTLQVIKNFIPHIFRNFSDYVAIISKNIPQSARNFQMMKELEGLGVMLDKDPMYKLAQDLLFKRALHRPNRRTFFNLLTDSSIMNHLKSQYKPEHRARLIALIQSCDHKELEGEHFRNIKNLLDLDPSIADELLTTYADKLYARGSGDQGANIKRLIKACKTFPHFSPKKVLVWLSNNNRIANIKFLTAAFPELKPLVPFV
jgi:hypothetical protein